MVHMRRHLSGASTALLTLLALAACQATPPQSPQDGHVLGTTIGRLPTGVHLDPAAPQHPVLSFPLGMAVAPDSAHVAMSMDGWTTQGVQIVDRATGAVTQTLEQPAAFIGIAFAPDGHMLYASGGNQDVIYRYDWAAGHATLRDSIVLAVKRNPRWSGTRYPAGIAFSPDGRRLYVAENLADSLAVIDVATGQVLHRYATGSYPYGVVVDPAGNVYVSAWGGFTVSEFTPAGDGYTAREIRVGRHPSALLLNRTGTRLFVASGSTDRVIVVGTHDHRVIETLLDPPPAGPGEGSTPNALALSPDGTRLYVAEADANAIAVFDLAPDDVGNSDRHGQRPAGGADPHGVVSVTRRGVSRHAVRGHVQGHGDARQPRGAVADPQRGSQQGAQLHAGPARRLGNDGAGGGRDGCGARRAQRAGHPGQRVGRRDGPRGNLPALQARHLHHQGEPDVRRGVRRHGVG